jgi:D-arabinose 1-dehydrogenase-like Zn-dependent alcohol dehydrogenase
MAKMRAVQIKAPGAPFEIVEREVPQPGPGTVRLKVEACGICHSDAFVKYGGFPGLSHPRVPGHEIAGVVDAVGAGVTAWKVGQRAGVGWHGGHCFTCESCRRGDFILCEKGRITAIHSDGGYAEYTIAQAEALAAIPDKLTAAEAAPLLCAGVTTYNSLRTSGARAGDLVAILGLGGLGHLGVQFAAKMGFRPVGIARGKDKAALAEKLGAAVYIDSSAQDPAAELQKLGGAKVILATASSSAAMMAVFGGLGIAGKLIVVGADMAPLQIPPVALLGKRLTIQGWPSGTAMDSQDTMNFCALTGVRSMNETFPFEKASEAFDRMSSGNARFRVVLTTGR